jgi:hypothetical protein
MADRLGAEPSSLGMVGDNVHRDLLGAEGAGYGWGFLVRRGNTLPVSGDPLLPPGVAGGPHLVEVRSLRELRWYLPRERPRDRRGRA